MINKLSNKNRLALAAVVIGFLLSLIIMALPIYSFDCNIYTKKSSNTFVGDEKYNEVLAEVNAIADEFREQGMDVSLKESVTERTNSKGKVTSLVTFTLSESTQKNLFSFFSQSLRSSTAFKIMLFCSFLSFAFCIWGIITTADTPLRMLDTKYKVIRSCAGWFALIAIITVPVFVMMNNYTFSRELGLFVKEVMTEGKEEAFEKIAKYLFSHLEGDALEDAIKGLSFSFKKSIWLLLPCYMAMLVGTVQLRHDSVSETLLKGLMYVFIIVVCVITIYPYYVMLITAFRTNAETTDMYFKYLFPTKWEWENLFHIASRGVPKYLLNSLLIAGGATSVAMICGIPAAYAMARMNFKGKNVFLGFVIMSQMFSPVVLLIGISQLMTTLHLNDSIIGLVLINAAFNQAFAVWLLRGTFVSISSEMEQAALIDGCGTFGALIKVLIPMAAPGIVTALIFIFINAWNEYTISTVLISTAANRPITVGITQFSSFNMIEWQYLFSASLLATIPVVILFMCIEKHLTAGLTSGGVKG